MDENSLGTSLTYYQESGHSSHNCCIVIEWQVAAVHHTPIMPFTRHSGERSCKSQCTFRLDKDKDSTFFLIQQRFDDWLNSPFQHSCAGLSVSVIIVAHPSVSSTADKDYFNHVSSEILDNVAPFKMRCHKVKNQTWLNDVTRNMRRVCRQA